MGIQDMKFYFCFITLLLFSSPGHTEKILLLGDSLSAAYDISWEKGWVQLLQHEISDEHELINASVSGETTGGGLARLPALLEEHQPDWVIIELGGNDGLRGYPLSVIRKNLLQMGNLVQQANAGLIYFGIRIPANYGQRYNDAFTAIFPEVAEQLQASYLDLYIEELALDPTMMQEDKLHPTEKAQPVLKEFVKQFLLKQIN